MLDIRHMKHESKPNNPNLDGETGLDTNTHALFFPIIRMKIRLSISNHYNSDAEKSYFLESSYLISLV